MQFPRDAASFFILKFEETDRELFFLDGLFGFFAFGDVPGHPKLHEGAIRSKEGRGMGLHVAALAVKPDDIELQRTFLSRANSFVKSTKAFAVPRRDEVVRALAYDHLSGSGTNHGEAGRIHLQHSTVRGDE